MLLLINKFCNLKNIRGSHMGFDPTHWPGYINDDLPYFLNRITCSFTINPIQTLDERSWRPQSTIILRRLIFRRMRLPQVAGNLDENSRYRFPVNLAIVISVNLAIVISGLPYCPSRRWRHFPRYRFPVNLPIVISVNHGA